MKSRMAHRSPRPFSIGVPVSASRERAGSRRSCWAVSLAGFLIAWASSSTIRPHSTAASASTSRTAVAYVVITMSASAMAPCSCSAVGRDAAVVDEHAQPGHEAGGLGRPVADDGGRRDDEGRAQLGRAGQLGEHRRRLAEAHVEGQAPAELGGVEEADPAEGVGLVGAQLPDEALRPGDRRRRRRAGAAQDVGGPAVAADVDAAAQPGAAEADALAEDLGARSAASSAPARPARLRPARDRRGRSRPSRRRDLISGRAWRARRATSAAEQLDVVEQHGPRRRCSAGARRPPIRPASRRRAAATASPCVATASARGRRSRRWRGPGRRAVIRSHASSWLRATWPRRCVADRLSAGESRPSRIHSAATGRPSRSVRSAASTGIGAPLPDGACTDSSHTPPASGASSWTIRRGRDADVTVRVQLVSIRETSPARADGRRERRAVHAGDDGVAHVPGRAHRRGRRRELQALDALGGDRLDDGGDDRGHDRPGRCRGRRPPPWPASPRRARRSSGCPSAPAASARRRWSCGSADRDSIRSVGTIDPAAARRTPSRATRPSQSTPAPTPSSPWPPPTATSQPRASLAGIASASAFCPPGS